MCPWRARRTEVTGPGVDLMDTTPEEAPRLGEMALLSVDLPEALGDLLGAILAALRAPGMIRAARAVVGSLRGDQQVAVEVRRGIPGADRRPQGCLRTPRIETRSCDG